MTSNPSPEPTTLCGRPGYLSLVGEDPRGEGCFLWRTDQALLARTELPADASLSLYALACDVAELYHQRQAFYLSDLPGTVLEVIWLELAPDESLLVFLKPLPHASSPSLNHLSQQL